MLARLKELKEELTFWWDDQLWLSSPEKKEMVQAKLAAHQLAMAEGYESPYTDPDNYDAAWRPIVKRQKSSE